MRRAARIIFHLAAGVSGVLFLVAVGFWIASYGSCYWLGGGSAPTYRAVLISRGELQVSSLSYASESNGAGWPLSRGKDPPEDLAAQSYLVFPSDSRPVAGFLFQRPDLKGVTGFRVLLPLPFLVFLFALVTLADVTLVRLRRRRQLAAGLCVRCGYDLRASPDRCPECGAVPAAVGSRR